MVDRSLAIDEAQLPSVTGLRYIVLFDSGEMAMRDAVGPFDSIEQIDELPSWPEPFEFDLDLDEGRWRRTGVYLAKPIAGTDYQSTGEILEEQLNSPLIKWLFFGSYPQMRNAAAKAVWPLCEPPRATIMAPVGLSRTKIPPYPPATASRGVPAPMSWRISNDRLWPATWSRYRLCTFSRPRSQVRRMPPRSRLWAKQRSTISARSLKASRATPDLSRARLLVTARRAASSPCQREKPVCLGRRDPGLPGTVVQSPQDRP